MPARRRGVRLPRKVPPWDVVLRGEASEVIDEQRGDGIRRAVGDLLCCPFCTSAWTADALVCS
ncbi:DUF1360 domain-containing protein [Streptomyces sp. NPDC001817]|uniref:DUF1360 domain-containing protein n=1 Tax=Streptomyces sp. NPDC001817 TaxID=3154398 RepID=UPI003319232F